MKAHTMPELHVGDTYYDYDGYKCHIANIFEDRGNKLYNIAYYGRRKQRWFYEVKTKFQLELYYDAHPERFNIRER